MKKIRKTASPSPLKFSTRWQYDPSPESTDHIQLEEQYGLFINGKFVNPTKEKYFDTINPATEQPLAKIAEAGPEDVDKAVSAARKAYENVWSKMEPGERGK